MNIKRFLFIASMLALSCCKDPVQQTKGESFSLQKLADSLPVNKEKNIFIYSINPNDCINCLYGFSSLNKQLAESANAKVFVMYVEREIEKAEMIRTTQNFSLEDSINKVVLWNKDLFRKIMELNRNKMVLSSLTIYNYGTDSVIYYKPVKEIYDTQELNIYIDN